MGDDAEQGNGLARREAVVLHEVERDERAGAAAAGAAVDGDGGREALDDGQELGDGVDGRRGAVLAAQVHHHDPRSLKPPAVVRRRVAAQHRHRPERRKHVGEVAPKAAVHSAGKVCPLMSLLGTTTCRSALADLSVSAMEIERIRIPRHISVRIVGDIRN